MEGLNDWLGAMQAEWLGYGPLVVSGGLVAVGLLLHMLLGFIVRRLHRVAGHSNNRWDDVVISALEVPLRLVLWVVVICLLLVLHTAGEGWRSFVFEAYDTALVLLLAWFLHRLVYYSEIELLSGDRGQKTSTDKATVHAIAKLLRITLWVLAALMALQSIGVSVSGLLAFGGIGGIAVGFAAKDLLANFFGAMTIFLDRPFAPGDWIRSPDREIEGTVEEISWRLTRIRTFDQRPLYVPNAVFSQIAVENPSRMLNRRIYETIGLRYQDSAAMGDVVAAVRSMLESHEEIDTGRTLIVNFVSFGASSLDFFVYAFTKTTVWVEYHRIKQEILLNILQIIHDHGADVAFPTRTLHLQQVEAEIAAGEGAAAEQDGGV
ncbi:mechanosensitive ion channel family protein [Parahaliea aestuarii]|uniref:Mechanosensitive ion channel family protein n=1 Tax=Parahaliea aestuarii TaxID=1852021 RepID=A0A5C8ZX79_9GAMM|nr:mechanosensitive ion channel family protein [Parahaliea aestuarii]TXS93173.1 mechanosensitive ion channel family protein [Parahaliea aestuarii]